MLTKQDRSRWRYPRAGGRCRRTARYPVAADDEGAGAGFVLVGEGVFGLDDGVLGQALFVVAGVELGIKGKDVGGHGLHQRVGLGGDDVDGVVVDDLGRGKRSEEALEVFAFATPKIIDDRN